MHYEFEVRKKQAYLINKGQDFRGALKAAAKDLEIRGRHFVTPMAVSAVCQARSSAAAQARGWWRPPSQGIEGPKQRGQGQGRRRQQQG